MSSAAVLGKSAPAQPSQQRAAADAMAAEEPERAELQYTFTDQRLAAALDDIEDGFKPGSAGQATPDDVAMELGSSDPVVV